MCLAWGGDNLLLVGGACAGRPGWSPQQQLGGRGWRGAACPPLAPPSPAQHGHRASAVLPPPGGSSFSAQRESGSAFVRLPEGRKRTPWRGRPGLRRPSFPSSCWGPGPHLAPALRSCRGRVPLRLPTPAFSSRPDGLHSRSGPSGAFRVHIRQMGVQWGREPSPPEDGAFRAPRASVLPGKSSPSARPSLPPLTFIFQVPPFL